VRGPHGGGRRETNRKRKNASVSCARAPLAQSRDFLLSPVPGNAASSLRQCSQTRRKCQGGLPFEPKERAMANQRCEAPAERRTTNQHQTPTQKTKRVPLPSQLVERLYSHAGPAGRRGAPGSGEEAQPDARGGVEAALEERRFGELRRWLHLRRRRWGSLRGRRRWHLELSSCCRCWQRRRRRRRARGRGRRHTRRKGGKRGREKRAGSLLSLLSLRLFFLFQILDSVEKSYRLEKKNGASLSLVSLFLSRLCAARPAARSEYTMLVPL
jgi:hypothetical protein